MDRPAFHMVHVPRLCDEYAHATANIAYHDNDKAIRLLKEIRDRVEKALALTDGKPIERLHYREALDRIIKEEDGMGFDIAFEAIALFTDWKAVDDNPEIAA